ncbi:MAG TPA: ABC transporter permease [Polyangiaceae bacterium]|jgi:ABC-type transport system involved in multi-copper enzyme maturation permease subunit
MTASVAPPSVAAKKPGRLARIFREPNAIWMREMRQAARLGRTPWILFALSLTISLLMCSIGGIAATDNASPASLGGVLFQTFFSIAVFVVMVVGPTVAANSIASEREGRTWEAVLLTGLSPREIARGKFVAAYTSIAMHIVVLAPVGALPFLFGGVTPLEVIVAFAFLFVFAALAVAFGLAVSSLMSSLRGAIVVTLILAILIGPILYLIFGLTTSYGIHKLWPDVPEAFPIWLPLAYTRAPFGLEYLLLLVAVPLLLILVPAWFLYAVTVSNLTGETDDRSTGLKLWFFACTPLVVLACALPGAVALDDAERVKWSVLGETAFAAYAGFCALLFAFDPAGPSRRVLVHWRRMGAGVMRRFFGPGMPKTASLVVLLGFLGLLVIPAIDLAMLYVQPSASAGTFAAGSAYWSPYVATRNDRLAQIFVFGAYCAPYFVFTMGLVAYFRSRGHTAWIARLIASAILFLAAAAPWVVAAIGGVVTSTHDDSWLVVAAPSPFFAYAMVGQFDHASSGADAPIVQAGLAAAMMWGLLGLVFLVIAGRRCARTVRDQNQAYLQTDAALRAEDDARAAAALASDAPASSAGAPA